MFSLIDTAVARLRKKATRLANIRVKNIAAVARPANKRSWLVVKREDPMYPPPTFDDFLHDRAVAKQYRARRPIDDESDAAHVERATEDNDMAVPKKPKLDFSGVDFEAIAKRIIDDAIRKATETAVDERERLMVEYIHAHPAETRVNAVDAVYRANEGLYERCRREETVDRHGRRLSEIYDRASASFGVDQHGRPVAKRGHSADEEVTIKAKMVMAKATGGLTFAQAVDTVFKNQPELYARWRHESQA